MSASKRIFSMTLHNYFQIFIILLCISQLKSETAPMTKEGLREEQLLPVRMTREVSESGVEGSGDDDSIPIRSLRGGMMERMTLKQDANKISEESSEDTKSKELIEGSGFEDATPKVAAALSTETNNTAETFDEDSTEEQDISDVENITKEEDEEDEEEAVTESTVTEINLEATTMKEETTLSVETTTLENIRETTTEAIAIAVTEEVTTQVKEETTEGKEEVTILPEIKEEDKTEADTTTAKTTTTIIFEEPKVVTEVFETKQVKQVFATEVTKKVSEEEPKTTTVIPPIIVPDNVAIIENENLTAGTDTLLMKINSKLLDAKETIEESSKDPSRLGTYIVISLILLSFLSLIGFILMKRRVQKRRKKSNMDPETLDTEKALLSLSEYKDHPDGVDEGKIKNNEITPIVIKSNAKINKFEKNTNFSSPKNLNTKANEKNVEKDNVLKKTSDNLTHVIIEDPAKDVEEEKAQTNAEKFIVRTHLDQDSIPKKPVIINRTSLGCVPVSQD